MRPFSRICVYCGSSDHVDTRFKQSAKSLGTFLAENGIGLVYGGGSVGLMGIVADACLAGGGSVIGVIPQKLHELELAHTGCDELIVVETMHQRKAKMAELSDAFIALPGGWGTLEELAEATTWTQLNYHYKPVGLLNVDGFYDHLLAWIAHSASQGFIRPAHADLVCTATSPAALLSQLAHAAIPDLETALSES